VPLPLPELQVRVGQVTAAAGQLLYQLPTCSPEVAGSDRHETCRVRRGAIKYSTQFI